MKKCRSLWLTVCGFLLIFTTACKTTNSLQDWMVPNGKIKVLCTTAIVADIVKQVGGDSIDCLTLIQGESDPHSYQLVKGDDEKFARADLIFYSGLGLEHGPSLRAVLEGSSKAYSLGDYLYKIVPDKIVFVDKTIDPHVWMDVGLWRNSAIFVGNVLAEAVPFQKETFYKNAKDVMKRLKLIDAEIADRLREIPENFRYLVTTHDAFNYFTKAYLAPQRELSSDLWRIRCEAPEGLAPDSQLSTADIQQLVDHLFRFKIATIFAESNVSRDSLKKIIDVMARKGHVVKISQKTLYADAMGDSESGADTYSAMMQYNSKVIAEGLVNGT